MQESYEKGVAMRSSLPMSSGAARYLAKRKQRYRWAGYRASKNCNQDADAVDLAEGNMTEGARRLLDHATVVSGSETPATATLFISGDENMDGGIDWLHLYFRDTRYTVTSTDCRVETQLTAAVKAGDVSLPVD